MKKFAVRSDMEGLFGVVSWEEVIPGTPAYERARGWLHLEVTALVEGLVEGGADLVEIYDEHYFGLNLDVSLLPSEAVVFRAKPPYREDWPGGLDASCSGLVLQGYHAMWGTDGGILPHTYEPDIHAIWINGTLVGEIGVEAVIAGEAGVPLVLLLGDRHGASEARALVPEVETVIVKEGIKGQGGLCKSWKAVRQEIFETAKKIARQGSSASPLRFGPEVEMRILLGEGGYRDLVFQDYENFIEEENLVLRGSSVTSVWAKYWAMKDRVLRKLKEGTK